MTGALYDIRLDLHYDYDGGARGDRHLIRVMPITIPGVQRVIAASLTFDPKPDRQMVFADFFGNAVNTLAYHEGHEHLDIRLAARVAVDDLVAPPDVSPDIAGLRRDLSAIWSIGPNSPHHFVGPSPRVALDPAITAYARQSLDRADTVRAAAMDYCLSIYRDFTYDGEATEVDTDPSAAFALRRGVCQDFAHIMIAGLRGLGIPAGYVSGFIRTIPPKGEARLEGADAMHAWVRVWCGQDAGWLEFDPTNAMLAGPDHITIGHGRDYADISPIVGVVRTAGGQEHTQAVDVLRVE